MFVYKYALEQIQNQTKIKYLKITQTQLIIISWTAINLCPTKAKI